MVGVGIRVSRWTRIEVSPSRSERRPLTLAHGVDVHTMQPRLQSLGGNGNLDFLARVVLHLDELGRASDPVARDRRVGTSRFLASRSPATGLVAPGLVSCLGERHARDYHRGRQRSGENIAVLHRLVPPVERSTYCGHEEPILYRAAAPLA